MSWRWFEGRPSSDELDLREARDSLNFFSWSAFVPGLDLRGARRLEASLAQSGFGRLMHGLVDPRLSYAFWLSPRAADLVMRGFLDDGASPPSGGPNRREAVELLAPLLADMEFVLERPPRDGREKVSDTVPPVGLSRSRHFGPARDVEKEWSISWSVLEHPEALAAVETINQIDRGYGARALDPFRYHLLGTDIPLLAEFVDSIGTGSTSEDLRGSVLDDVAVFADVTWLEHEDPWAGW